MKQSDQTFLYGVEPFLAIAALVVATVDAVVFPLLLLEKPVPAWIVPTLATTSGALATLLFVRLLASREHHHAIARANAELQADRPFWLSFRKPNDPDWGFFGARMGRGYLVPLRLVLMVEFFAAIVLVPQDRPLFALIIFSGAAVTLLLTLSQLRTHFPRSSPRPNAPSGLL